MRHSYLVLLSSLALLAALAVPTITPDKAGTPEPNITLRTQAVANNQEADVAENRLRQESATDEKRSAPTATATANQRVYDVLDKSVSFDFDEIEFSEVMVLLREQHDINVILDQSAREDSLPEDEPVSFQIRDTRLKDALKLMLKKKNACIAVKDGVLRIISRDVAPDPEFHERMIIDVKEILELMNKLDRPGADEQTQTGAIQVFVSDGQGGGLGRGVRGGGVFQVADNQEQDTPAETAPDEDGIRAIKNGGQQEVTLKGNFIVNQHRYSAEQRLTRLIEETIYPEDWRSTNGEGRLNIVGGLLVVVNRFEINYEIKDFIKELEFHLNR